MCFPASLLPAKQGSREAGKQPFRVAIACHQASSCASEAGHIKGPPMPTLKGCFPASSEAAHALQATRRAASLLRWKQGLVP